MSSRINTLKTIVSLGLTNVTFGLPMKGGTQEKVNSIYET